MKNHVYILAAFCLTWKAPSSASPVNTAGFDSLFAAITKHEKELVSLSNSMEKWDDQKTEFRKGLESLKLRNKSPGKNLVNLFRFYSKLVLYGRTRDDGFQSEIIERELTYRILVATLFWHTDSLFQLAIVPLVKHGEPLRLMTYKSTILAAVNSQNKAGKMALRQVVALLPLDFAESRTYLGEMDKLDPKIQARLGDSLARESIIEAFKNETDFEKKKKLSADLAYIGGAASANALASEFFSPVVGFQYIDRISNKVPILEALAKLLPHDSVVTYQYIRMLKDLEGHGLRDSQRCAIIFNYYDLFRQWSKSKLSVSSSVKNPEPIFQMSGNNSLRCDDK